MKQVNFDAPAILEKAIVVKTGDGSYDIKSTQQIHSGTLAECVHEFSQKPDSQKSLYNILTSDDAKAGKLNLVSEDIELLTKEPNYPLRAL